VPPLTENKLVLVVRRTRLSELIVRFNTEAQARFYVEHLGADFSDYQREHATYRQAVARAESLLGALGRVHTLERAFLPNYVFGPHDLLVVLGQDGLVANTVKYLSGQRLLGVNPDPARWEGVLLPFEVEDLSRIVPETFAQRRPIREVTMARASLNNGQSMLAVNDLFIGPKSHGSARYAIRLGGQEENQSSSGVIVSTGLGSTGWFKSLINGATGITARFSGGPPALPQETSFPWDAECLRFTVREPFPSKTSAATLVYGQVERDIPLVLSSQMAENGVIFSDGIEADFLEFNSGTRATITLADERGHLVL
jgi:NAD kinase